MTKFMFALFVILFLGLATAQAADSVVVEGVLHKHGNSYVLHTTFSNTVPINTDFNVLFLNPRTEHTLQQYGQGRVVVRGYVAYGGRTRYILVEVLERSRLYRPQEHRRRD